MWTLREMMVPQQSQRRRRTSSHPLGRSNNSIGNKNLQFRHPAWQHVTSFKLKKSTKKAKTQTKRCRLSASTAAEIMCWHAMACLHLASVEVRMYLCPCATAFLVGFLKLLVVASSPRSPYRAVGGPKSEWRQHLWSVCLAILLQLQLQSRRWRRGATMWIYGFQVATGGMLPR